MKAKVIRGVFIRGKAHAEGAIGSVGKKQDGDAFELTPQEFNELKASNYVVAHVETPAAGPVESAPPKIADIQAASAQASAMTKAAK